MRNRDKAGRHDWGELFEPADFVAAVPVGDVPVVALFYAFDFQVAAAADAYDAAQCKRGGTTEAERVMEEGRPVCCAQTKQANQRWLRTIALASADRTVRVARAGADFGIVHTVAAEWRGNTVARDCMFEARSRRPDFAGARARAAIGIRGACDVAEPRAAAAPRRRVDASRAVVACAAAFFCGQAAQQIAAGVWRLLRFRIKCAGFASLAAGAVVLAQAGLFDVWATDAVVAVTAVAVDTAGYRMIRRRGAGTAATTVGVGRAARQIADAAQTIGIRRTS